MARAQDLGPPREHCYAVDDWDHDGDRHPRIYVGWYVKKAFIEGLQSGLCAVEKVERRGCTRIDVGQRVGKLLEDGSVGEWWLVEMQHRELEVELQHFWDGMFVSLDSGLKDGMLTGQLTVIP